MPVSDQHTKYNSALPKWQLVRDCEEGSRAVKKRAKAAGKNRLTGLAGTAYLPPPNDSDTSISNTIRYEHYRERAQFVNYTAQTKEGMLGMVFRKETEIELDANVEYLIENANGGGLTLDQQIKDVTGEAMGVGRVGLLVDYPEAPAGLTEAQVRSLNLRANICIYETESIINWQTTTIGGIHKLSMVVLKEPHSEYSADGFTVTEKPYHRVLLLRDGVYIQQLYDDDDNIVVWTDNEGEAITDIVPRKSDGTTWDTIPFVICGSTNNDPTVDKAPLFDIADLNIGHYRNSAEFEESCYMAGQPTLAMVGLTQSWIDDNFADGVIIGSRSALFLPEGGGAQLLQAAGNVLPQEAMKAKEEQMIAIGARLIQDTGGVETAEAAKIRFAGQNSKIASVLINVESAYKQSVMWAMDFMGGTTEPEITINKELYDKTLDPQMVMAQIQLLDRSIIAKKDLRDNLRKSSLIDPDRTDEDIDNESETVDNAGLFSMQ